MKPRESILYWKPGRYVNSAQTDLRKTFARVKREQLRERIESQGQHYEASIINLKRSGQ